MTRQWTCLAALMSAALGAGGCFPDDLPGYVSGGKVVVTLAADANGRQALWTYHVETHRTAPHPPPAGWQIQSARMLGDQVWARLQRPREASAAPGAQPAWEYACMRFDPAGGQFLPGPAELEGKDWLWAAIPASYEGRKCLLMEEVGSHAVWSFPLLEKQDPAALHKPMSAGRWWWIQFHAEAGDEPGQDAGRIDLYNPAGQLACTIPASEANRAGQQLGPPLLARMSADGGAVLLAYGSEPYSFGVLDARTGKFLWGGKTRSLVGVPLVRKDEVWTLAATVAEEEAADDPSRKATRYGIALVKHKSGQEAGDDGVTGSAVLEYPVEADPRKGRFAPSPDGSRFVVILEGKPPLLLFIPIKDGVKEEDVKQVELRAHGEDELE